MKKPKRPRAKKPAPKPIFARKPPPPPEIPRGGGGVSSTRKRSSRKSPSQIGQELAEAYRVVFASPQGQRVKADLLTYCSVYNPIAGKDLFEVGQRVGERNVALRIAQFLGLRPEHFADDAWEQSSTLDQMMIA